MKFIHNMSKGMAAYPIQRMSRSILTNHNTVADGTKTANLTDVNQLRIAPDVGHSTDFKVIEVHSHIAHGNTRLQYQLCIRPQVAQA
tara:strand:- start:3855 stop:4115 length:261 start_codon:yes stop_codon:yes gene_type:complete